MKLYKNIYSIEQKLNLTFKEATVIINNRTFYRSENENIFIPKKAKHRVLNESSKKKLVLIEVQTGSKFIESDIKRYSDIYGRKN